MSGRVLCACGKSKTFPLCDGSHVSEGWTCLQSSSAATLAVTSSPRFETLARKLSSELAASLCLPGTQRTFPTSIETLIVLTDAMDLAAVHDVYRKLRPRSTSAIVLALSPGASLLTSHFQACSLWDLAALDLEAFRVFSAALAIVREPAGYVRQLRNMGVTQVMAQVAPKGKQVVEKRRGRRLHSAFVSHAVRDEHILQKPLRLLREWYKAELFLCADSIPPTANWYQEIEENLRESGVFICLISASLVASKFCAFEMGAAVALKKPMYLISVDGTMPPAFVQHLQCVDVPRMQRLKPWLDTEDIVCEEMIKAMTQYCETCETSSSFSTPGGRFARRSSAATPSWLLPAGLFLAASACFLAAARSNAT